MLKSLESAVSAFMLMTVACTFGLSLAIGVAGVTKSKTPFACGDCTTMTVAAAAPTSAG